MTLTHLIIFFVIYITLAIVILVKDPTGHLKVYDGLYIALAMVGFFIIFSMIYIKVNKKELNIPGYGFFFKNVAAVFGIIGVILGIIMFILYFLGNPSPTFVAVTIILNIVILIVTLALIYNAITTSKHVKLENTYLNLIKNIIFYIPCLFIHFIEAIKAEYNITTKTSLIILAFDIAVILLSKYWNTIVSVVTNKGGIILQKDPVYLNHKNIIGTFEKIYGDDPEFRYKFAISCDLYINPQPPNTNPAYSKFTSLLNFGDKPNIMYKADTNTLKIIIKLNNDTTKELVVKKGIPLQKWNSLVINYDHGTMDVFLNKEIISSHKSVAPFMTFDNLVIGTDGGIHGGIKNVIYFNKSLNLRKILML